MLSDPCCLIIDINYLECTPPVKRYKLSDIINGYSAGNGTLAERLCKWLISNLKENGGDLPVFSAKTKYSAERGRHSPIDHITTVLISYQLQHAALLNICDHSVGLRKCNYI